MIGNSRLHWALFVDGTLTEAWDTNHLSATAGEQLLQDWASGIMPAAILASVSWKTNLSQLPLYIASVVPAQTKLWQNYPAAQVITLADLPLQGIYPTLGIDRALAVLGAGETYGYPVLM
ncbi:MAG: type III pantothenate kinase, partial [Symploca sp. SIO2D2]|nr:type III pantothenate kinase [Symploca sp. SIO2D2]